jgi:hypothetical protein
MTLTAVAAFFASSISFSPDCFFEMLIQKNVRVKAP